MSGKKTRKDCVVAVIENGETRCGTTTAFFGLGGIPYRLIRRFNGKDGKPLPLFDNMRLQREVSLEQYQDWLDHPENADDFSAMIEVDVDHNIIRVDEDMGQEREYHEFPMDAFLEQSKQLISSGKKAGPNAIRQERIYPAMKKIEIKPQEQGPAMQMGGI